MNLKKIIIAVLASLFIFTSCESTPDTTSAATPKNTSVKKASSEPIFDAWKGEWHSLETGLKDKSLNQVYTKVASSMPNYTTDGLKAAVEQMYSTGTNISKIKFDGSSKVVFTVFSEGSEKQITAEYVYVGKKSIPGYDNFSWECFESTKTVRGLTNAKYMIFTVVHGGDEGMEHFHCRFNGRSFESAIANTNWPTFVRTSITKSDIIKQHSENISNYAKMLPSSPFEDFAKEGKWVNRRVVYSNKSAVVDSAYKKLIKEFTGKNPKGGDFTKSELVSLLEDKFGTTDFTSVEFNTKDGKNEMKIFKDGKLIFESSYKRVAENPSKSGMLAVKADKENAGKYSLISFTAIHGSPKHSHFWYGKTDIDIANFSGGTPTLMAANSTDAEIASHIENAGRRILTELTK